MNYKNKLNIEVEGKTVDDAINKAIEIFKVPRESLYIQIIAEEKKGLFGMEGEKPAKIKVSIKNNID